MVSVALLGYWLVNRMPATCWEVLVRTGFESLWGQISVALLVAYVAMLGLRWLSRGWGTDTTYHLLGLQHRT